MKKGEVWRLRMPLRDGHAQAGERPAVIVQNDTFTARLRTVLVVPFTSKLKTANFPGILIIQPDGKNGLAAASVALVFQLTAVDQRSLLRLEGNLDSQTLDHIEDLIEQLVG